MQTPTSPERHPRPFSDFASPQKVSKRARFYSEGMSTPASVATPHHVDYVDQSNVDEGGGVPPSQVKAENPLTPPVKTLGMSGAASSRLLPRSGPELSVSSDSPPSQRSSSRPLRERLQDALMSCNPGRAEPAVRQVMKRSQWNEQRVQPGSPPAQQATWEPPVSPFGLLEEQLFHMPWKLLLGCMLLNKTTAKQVRKIWPPLMEVIPSPEDAAHADVAVLEAIIRPLGFFRFRARAIGAMSSDFLQPWTRPSELRFIGKYASDAYFIFCRGKWRDVCPDDKDLIKYHSWLEQHDGEGVGLIRDALL